MSALILPPILQKQRLFTLSEARREGFSEHQLRKLLLEKTIERLGRGVYRLSSGDISEEENFRLASIWLGKPSAVCLLSALSYYNLTDEIPKQTWVMVTRSKISRHKELKLIRVRSPKWGIGIEKQKDFWITSITRTIVDAFAHPQIVGTQIAVDSLRRALAEKLTSAQAVYKMAIQLGIARRILPYVESLS